MSEIIVLQMILEVMYVIFLVLQYFVIKDASPKA